MRKILLIFGTRPEAIKLAPVELRLRESGRFRVKVAVTGQHRQMLDQVLALFGIAPDYDLGLMQPGQDLFDLTGRGLSGLKEVLRRERPDLVMVQGDTTSCLVGALAAYYERIPVAHVEAGLRTGKKYAPFPEELNRRLAGVLADYHFAPTPWARDNLRAEGVAPQRIWVTGNTVIDALQMVTARVKAEEERWRRYLKESYGLGLDGRRLVLVTGHRRENFGPPLENICLALRDLVERHADLHLVYPVHLNPNVQDPVYGLLAEAGELAVRAGQVCHLKTTDGGCLSLLPPLEYAPFVFLLSRCYLVLTDSGGVQEEAPALGKPVLVMREVTERPEGVWAGTAKPVGTDRKQIYQAVTELLENSAHYQAMAQVRSPYGDGRAAERIARILQEVI
jgi:UDP-N-acetylglucosamine 2-epimerase (non-hydrolysing)|uniref:UDP-N-acetylglucosamine 2-epimerase (non-hydrolyzing) n=1 Tax=Desulfobacca acetoxidans TaxID=60893 RepID=A0A7C3WQK8_9BACT